MSSKGTVATKTRKALLTLVVLALLAVTLQSLVFSGASFFRTSANPGNAFAAGSLSHTNSKNGQVVLAATALRPGQSQAGTLTITGGGNFTQAYTISKATLVDTPASPGLSNALTLQIEDITGAATTLFNGTAASFTQVSGGTIAVGATRTYRFTLTYPTAAADTRLQGATMTLTVLFTGVQQ